MSIQLGPGINVTFGVPGRAWQAAQIFTHADQFWPDSRGKLGLGEGGPIEPIESERTSTLTKQLMQADELRKSGAISDDEWQLLKARLLSQ